MDSLTQLTLGATVGEFMLGRKIGGRAALWGGVFGTVPDLDVTANFFLSEIQELAVHRGFTHSLLFTALAAPAVGALLARLQPRLPVTWREWSWLVFWALLTHIVLDCFTSYGTQIFQPFSDYPVIIGSIFIIDPLYTVPLLIGLLTALCLRRAAPARRIAIHAGLWLSTAYLSFTLVNKWHVDSVFTRALQAQGLRYESLFTLPTAFNNVLWIGLAKDARGLWVGHYSLLDGAHDIRFQRVDSNSHLLAPLLDDPAVERLLRFSRGYYTVRQEGEALRFDDLHLPRTDLWLLGHGDAIFSYRLLPDPRRPDRVLDVQRVRPPTRLIDGLWPIFVARLAGHPITIGTTPHLPTPSITN